jgi:aldehyde dehydrogenase (NAD+)
MRHEHWIDGHAVAPEKDAYISTVNPATRGPGDEIAAGSPGDVDRAVAAALAAQPGWAASSAAARSEVLHAVAAAMEAARDELIEVERATTGKISSQLQVEVDMSIAYFRYYAGVIRTLHGRTIDQGSANHTYTRLEPYGVVGVITPWNLPLNQACRALAPALAVGNAAIAKPAQLTSTSTLLLAQLATRAGMPDGVFNVVTGTGSDVGTPLAAHPAVRRVVFTGSFDVGRHLARIAADRLIPVTLELGGKSPIVVFADADLDRAAAAAVNAVAMNAGQVCSATTRLLVEDDAHDELVAKVVKLADQLEPGEHFGPIITESQYHEVLEHFAAAQAEGAAPATGGSAYDDGPGAEGFYIRPTVYADVHPDWKIARDEVFGPVLVTMRFDDEEGAVIRANDTEYGLVGAVWSGDLARGIRVAERIDAGQIAVNGGALTIETPFGGYKNSGYGREKGLEALHDYAQVKSISISL